MSETQKMRTSVYRMLLILFYQYKSTKNAPFNSCFNLQNNSWITYFHLRWNFCVRSDHISRI